MQKNANETAKETKNMFLQSAKELKAVTTLAACAMFAALAMILNRAARSSSDSPLMRCWHLLCMDASTIAKN